MEADIALLKSNVVSFFNGQQLDSYSIFFPYNTLVPTFLCLMETSNACHYNTFTFIDWCLNAPFSTIII